MSSPPPSAPTPTTTTRSSSTTPTILSSTSSSESSLHQNLETYPWSTDPEFQAGLTDILNNNSTSQPGPSQTEDLILHARCFYYTRYIAHQPPVP